MQQSSIDKPLTEIFARWRAWMRAEKNYSAHTASSYTTDLSIFFEFLSGHFGQRLTAEALGAITAQDVRAWLTSLASNDYNLSSSARYVASLRNFFNYLHRYEGITNNAAANVKLKRRAKPLPKALDMADAALAIDEAFNVSKELWVQLRDYALLTLIYCCGLRISEALSLTKSDLGGDYITIKGKGNKSRSVPILANVNQAIQDYLGKCPFHADPQQPLFVGKRGKKINPSVFQYQIRKIRSALGLSSSTTPHAFRHSFATHLLENGADLRSIQELLGHKNLSTTQIYTSVNTRKLLDSYSKHHPRSV